MINFIRSFQILVFVFILFFNTLLLGQGYKKDSKKDTEGFLFDIDEVKLEEPSLLKPEFHGFLSVGAPFSGGLDETEKDSSNVFNQTELTLWFGTQIFKNLEFDSELEMDDGFEEFELEKFELDWNVFNEKLVFRAGKFIYPFGIERLVESAPYNKLIDRPNPSIKIIPDTYSDAGLELYGIVPFLYKTKFKYELAVTNGLSSPEEKGEQRLGFEDNNDNKALGGRLGFELMPGLEVGGSYLTGKYDDDEKFSMNFIGADISFQKGGFEIRSEYIRSNVERSTIAGGSFDREGYYFQASYRYSPEMNYLSYIEGVARFDSVDSNDLVTDENDADRVALGINYSPMNHVKLKLEYEMENEAKEDREKKGFIQIIFSW
ncbi:MAG: porin [Candidatus Scalinduaceae bacterium]